MKRLFGIPFLIVGIALLYVHVGRIMEAQASKGWPTAAGVVEVSDVKSEDTRTQHGAGASDTHTFYMANVIYRYTANGQERRSARIAVSDTGSGTRAQAEEIASRYVVGTPVTVHYNEASPEKAMLEPGFGILMFAFPAIGLLFTLMGGGCLIYGPGPAHSTPVKAAA